MAQHRGRRSFRLKQNAGVIGTRLADEFTELRGVLRCNGPRSLPVTKPDSRLGVLTVFPSSPIVWTGPRRQGFASPRNNGAPLTAPGRSQARSERRERPRLVADHNVILSGGKIVEDYTEAQGD